MVNIFCQAEQTLYHSNATRIRNRKNMLVSGTIRLKKFKKKNRTKKNIACSYSTSEGILSVGLLWVTSLRSEMHFDQKDHKANDNVYFFDNLSGIYSSLRTGRSSG